MATFFRYSEYFERLFDIGYSLEEMERPAISAISMWPEDSEQIYIAFRFIMQEIINENLVNKKTIRALSEDILKIKYKLQEQIDEIKQGK